MGTLKVVVKSTIKETLPLSYLNVLQGNLKKLSDQNYQKLKNSIVKHGFIYPFFVWEDEKENKIYLIDGTQRHTTLEKMKEEGYKIPQLPVVFIPAKDIQDAKGKLLAAASYFGEFNLEGTKEFLADLDFDMDAISIPTIVFEPLVLEADENSLPEMTTVSEHQRKVAKEVDLDEFEKFEHKCPRCAHEWSDK